MLRGLQQQHDGSSFSVALTTIETEIVGMQFEFGASSSSTTSDKAAPACKTILYATTTRLLTHDGCGCSCRDELQTLPGREETLDAVACDIDSVEEVPAIK